jgi:putative ABC transport system permease protein
MNEKTKIPSMPHAFFKWYCKKDLYEEMHGDLEEFYYERIEELGSKKALFYYIWDVIRCFQPYAWKTPKTQNPQIVMFKNYYKTSIRSLMKNPTSSFINVIGLAAAIGVCVFTYGYGQWIFKLDQFHKNKNEVYLATFFADRDGTQQQNGRTPIPLGNMLREDFANIKKVCRIDDRNVVVKKADKVFHEKVRLTDSEFLDMFTFPLKWGRPNTLNDLNNIILSEEMSIKYFGEENPIGQNILLKFGEENGKLFSVTGVAEAFPEAHIISFDFLINFENLKIADVGFNLNDWSEFVRATFIQVDNPEDLIAIQKGMDKYRILQNETQNEWAITDFHFESLATLYKNSSEIREGISSRSFKGNLKGVLIMSVVALILLMLACLNYINISIVSASKRLKEIGIRKVIGANKGMVVTQFLLENIFITSFALLLGLLFGAAIVIPWFEQLFSANFDFNIQDKNLWIFLSAILIFTGVASGIYPAFYISKFQVVGILKGSVKFGQKNPMTRVLLGFQLILACILIASAVMFTQNTSYIANRSWGYSQFEALYAEVPDGIAYERLDAALNQNKNVLSIAGSTHHLGKNHTKAVLDLPEREYEVNQLSISANYLSIMGLQITQGRGFKENYESDQQSVIVNEKLVSNLKFDEPIGQVFKIDSITYEVIGVVKDFHSYNFSDEVESTIFKVAGSNEYRYISMKISPGKKQLAYDDLQAQWLALYPEIPFQGGFQEDVWGNYFYEISVHAKVWRGIAFIAVLLASLGLYGLVTLNVSGRIKEFSIRKVLGAERWNIAKSIIKQYTILFAIALFFGAPISYFSVDFLFDLAYPYHIPMNPLGVVVSIVMLIIILLVTVSSQVRKVSLSNPVNGLKVE